MATPFLAIPLALHLIGQFDMVAYPLWMLVRVAARLRSGRSVTSKNAMQSCMADEQESPRTNSAVSGQNSMLRTEPACVRHRNGVRADLHRVTHVSGNGN